MTVQPLEHHAMIFDQYSRYRACSDLLRSVIDTNGLTLLDVGSGLECLLGKFLPEARLHFVDPQFSPNTSPPSATCISGDILTISTPRNHYDFVVSVDTLEHVGPAKRKEFISRISGLAKQGILFGFPASDRGEAEETDRHVDNIYRSEFGTGYSWLKEHFELSLPSVEEVVNQLEELGWNCCVIGHGYVPWLQELLGLTICVWDIPEGKELVLDISRDFNEILYPYDFCSPSYRQFVLATREKVAGKVCSFPSVLPNEIVEFYAGLIERFRVGLLHVATSTHRNRNKLLDEHCALQQTREQLENDRAKLENDRAMLMAMLYAIQNSFSWRLTRPLRVLRRKFRREKIYDSGKGTTTQN